MSNMEKVIEQKLADARKRSEKKEETKSGGGGDKKSDQKKPSSSESKTNATSANDKKSSDQKKPSSSSDSRANANDRKPDPKKPSSSDSKSNSNASKTVKTDDKSKDTKPKDGGKPSESSRKPEPKGGNSSSVKKDDKSSGGGGGKDQDSKKPPAAGSSKESGKTSSSGSGKDSATSEKPKAAAAGSSTKPKPDDSKKPADKGSDKTSSSSGSGKDSASEKKPAGGGSSSKSSMSEDSKESIKASNSKESISEKKPAASSKTKPDDSKDKPKPKDATGSDDKTKEHKESQDTSKSGASDDKPKEGRQSRDTSKSRTSREKSKSPVPFVRNYHYKKHHSERYPYRGGRSPTRRRSRTRSRSRTPSRRRSRSPVRRRSPSPRRDTRRRSPRPRRSRSPRDRSPYRSYRGRSRSSERRDPKALMAKKSFLDDLAVKFAQEGKEFPELEQYRCEINSQFGSHPQPSNQRQFSRHAVEHIIPMEMDDMISEMNVPPINNPPIMMTDPYNAYPVYPETPSLVSYPIQGTEPSLNSPGLSFDSPHPSSASPFQNENINVAKSAKQKQNAGIQRPKSPEIWTKQEVKIRIKQALQLLDDADKGIRKTGKFMFRAPSFYGNDVNENRSPIVQSANNPLFAISHNDGKFSDPFGNVPPKVKAVVDVLRMDEGLVSERIFLRHQKNQETASTAREKLEAEERARRLDSSTLPCKVHLQKTTQTDPTVCTDCLLRKIKVRYNEETQTDIVRTVDSDAQTNPMPVQTVSEFGSITELTPNQVRAVSELIKYIKLTVTSGSLQEMRDSLKEDQVYNLNSDLRTAYHYFDAMVEHQKVGGAPKPMEDVGDTFEPEPEDDYNEPETFIEDENVDEYDQYHQAFADEYEEDNGEAELYSNPLLAASQPVNVKRTVDNRNTFGKARGHKNSFGTTRGGGHYGGPSRGHPGRGRGANKSIQSVPYNRRNYN